jgi:glycoside hydrolase-like protein
MTVRMYDGMTAPTADQAKALFDDGGRIYGGYLESPSATHPWSKADFARVGAAGFVVVPIYMAQLYTEPRGGSGPGARDAKDAVDQVRQLGMPSGTKIALDVEANRGTGPGVLAYATAWAETVRSIGYVPGVYGSPQMCSQGGAPFDWMWVAHYVGTEPRSPDHPGIGHCRGRRAWQWRGTHFEFGASVDRSIADDWLADGVTSEEDVEMFSCTDPKSGWKVLCDRTGAVFNFNADGTPGGRYLGALNNHPDFHAGDGQANGPVVAISTWDDGNPGLSGYVIITRDAAGTFHNYNFPSDGRLAH